MKYRDHSGHNIKYLRPVLHTGYFILNHILHNSVNVTVHRNVASRYKVCLSELHRRANWSACIVEISHTRVWWAVVVAGPNLLSHYQPRHSLTLHHCNWLLTVHHCKYRLRLDWIKITLTIVSVEHSNACEAKFICLKYTCNESIPWLKENPS